MGVGMIMFIGVLKVILKYGMSGKKMEIRVLVLVKMVSTMGFT